MFSSSSPSASVALLRDGHPLGFASLRTQNNASGALLNNFSWILDQLDLELESVDLFAADEGPGSFTGVRVGITIAKTFGFVLGKPVAAVSAFDLIHRVRAAAVPAKKGWYFLRTMGEEARMVPEDSAALADAVGYGAAFSEPVYPDAVNAASFLADLTKIEPEHLMPKYLVEPNITVPNKPFGIIGR